MLLNHDLIEKKFKNTHRLPSLFIGHGSPLLVLETPESHPFARHLSELGVLLKAHFTIDAICVISAHWLTNGTFVNTNREQEQIYDFGGFPDEMYQIKYSPKGHPDLAFEVQKAIPNSVITSEWGLDHGSWTVLKHMFPNADIPTFQISIDYHQPPNYHLEVGERLKRLNGKNILFLGSGNIIHNLRLAIPRLFANDTRPFGWEQSFEDAFNQALVDKNVQQIANYTELSEDALKSVPTPDHYYPALYVLGSIEESYEVITTYEEILPGISMKSFLVI